MSDKTTTDRPSLLDFASREAFSCDDYEPRGENVEDHIINPEDGIYTVLTKSKRLTDRILDGKSLAVALGDIKIKRREELEQKNFTLKEKHIWQLWKNAKGELPPMQWQVDQEEQQIVDQHDDQNSLGKRKSSGIQGGGQTEHRRRVKKRNGDETSQVTAIEMQALGEIYHLPKEARAQVVEVDVRYFRRTYAPLRPLLSAMTKMLQARSHSNHSGSDKKMEDELRLIELRSTQKAIYLVEKQAKWILDETVSMCDNIQEQVSIMRGRLSALENDQGDEDEEDLEEASLTAASPANSQEDSFQDQVEHDEIHARDAIELKPILEVIEPDHVSAPSPKHAEQRHASDNFSDQTMGHEQPEEMQHTSCQNQAVAYQSVGSKADSDTEFGEYKEHFDPESMVQSKVEASVDKSKETSISKLRHTQVEDDDDYDESICRPYESLYDLRRTMVSSTIQRDTKDESVQNKVLDTAQFQMQQQVEQKETDLRLPVVTPEPLQQPSPQKENSKSRFWQRLPEKPFPPTWSSRQETSTLPQVTCTIPTKPVKGEITATPSPDFPPQILQSPSPQSTDVVFSTYPTKYFFDSYD